MSVPRIPGYTDFERRTTLSDEWDRPSGEYPLSLWPTDGLTQVTPSPDGWVTIDQYEAASETNCVRGCVLVPVEQADLALSTCDWIGGDLGDFITLGSPNEEPADFLDGLRRHEGTISAEWFVHARKPAGSPHPEIEVSLPFLWFWDAFRSVEGWHYLDASGRAQELLRFHTAGDSWRIEVRANELRTFLRACRRTAVIYVRLTTTASAHDFARVDDTFQSEWAHFEFFATSESHLLEPESLSMVNGNYLLAGADTSKRRRVDDFEPPAGHPYEEFIYDVDPQTGRPLLHTCDPRALGTYSDKDSSKLHYLTPIYFRPNVLNQYTAEPRRYRVSRSYLSCPPLWGTDISFNSAGLVEVYLGDIGAKIPYQDWGHWRSHNVPPEGKTDEGRFRRDFLNQFASSPDPMGDLRTARDEANAACLAGLGSELWRPLPPDMELAFQSLVGPLTDDPAALDAPLLTLAKVFVDGLDSKLLKKLAPGAEKNEQSLSLLGKLLASRGDEEDTARILRSLYAARSRGGIAHLKNSGSSAVLAELGFVGGPQLPAFEQLVQRMARTVRRIGEILGPAE